MYLQINSLKPCVHSVANWFFDEYFYLGRKFICITNFNAQNYPQNNEKRESLLVAILRISTFATVILPVIGGIFIVFDYLLSKIPGSLDEEKLEERRKYWEQIIVGTAATDWKGRESKAAGELLKRILDSDLSQTRFKKIFVYDMGTGQTSVLFGSDSRYNVDWLEKFKEEDIADHEILALAYFKSNGYPIGNTPRERKLAGYHLINGTTPRRTFDTKEGTTALNFISYAIHPDDTQLNDQEWFPRLPKALYHFLAGPKSEADETLIDIQEQEIVSNI